MTDLEALVVAAYVFADEYRVPARCGRPPLTSDAELIALAVCQASIGASSDRQFLGLVGRVLPGWFPHLPEQSQYNRRLRGLVGLISIVQQRLARWLDTAGHGSLTAASSRSPTIPAALNEATSRALPVTATHAPSTLHLGVRLVLLTDARGLPLGYTIVPPTRKEYEPLADLLTGTPAQVVIADKGLWGRSYRERLAADGVTLLTPTGHEPPPTSPRARARLIAAGDRKRLLQPQRPDATRTTPRQNTRRPRRRIAQRILALTIGILLNTLHGRPARALAAYDGR